MQLSTPELLTKRSAQKTVRIATSRLADKLPNVIELAAVTGHKDLRMLKRYHHPKAEDLALKLGGTPIHKLY